MGNGNLKGGMHIHLEKFNFSPGDEVLGVVYLYLRESSPPGNLCLIFQGTEQTRWKQSNRKYFRNHAVCEYRFVLKNFNESITHNGVKVPFCFKLPYELPGSFVYGGLEETAQVVYNLTAEFQNQNSGFLSNSTGVCILENSQPFLVTEATASIQGLCCFSKGSVSFNLTTDKDYYTPEDLVTVKAHIDNSKCKSSITRTNLRLHRNLVFRDRSGNPKFETQCLLENCAEGVKAKQQGTVEIDLEIRAIKEIFAEMYSTEGHLVQCKYFVEVILELEGSAFSSPQFPTLEKIIPIHPVPSQKKPLPSKPSDWNPLEVPKVLLETSSQGKPQENSCNSETNRQTDAFDLSFTKLGY